MSTTYKTPTFNTDKRNQIDETYQTIKGSQFDSVCFGASSIGDYTQIYKTGTLMLRGSATAWDDLVMPMTIGKAGATVVEWSAWGTSNIYVYKFDSNDEVHFSFQLPHTWKGTIIYPHVHWCANTGAASPGIGLSAVRWNLETVWAGLPGGIWNTNSSTTYWATANVEDPNQQILTNIPLTGINPSTFNQGASSISSCFICRLYRGGVGDTYTTAKIVGVSFDIHYEKDGFGSQTIHEKTY